MPLFLLNQMLSAYLRNDKNPALATVAVLGGRHFQRVWRLLLCVCPAIWEPYGAGLATAIGAAITFVVLMTHFLTKKNTLRLVRPKGLAQKLGKISVTGFSTFFIDVAMGILTILFNRQITKYLGTSALAVYGVIVNISTFAQCCAYSVGQASQPIFSTNFGAGKGRRIRETLKYALGTARRLRRVLDSSSPWGCPICLSAFSMTPTEEVLAIAPGIFRCLRAVVPAAAF